MCADFSKADFSKKDSFGNASGNSIGTAMLEEDGTLILVLHRNFETRFNFGKVLSIKPDNPRYHKYLKHIGYLVHGERKSILPWQDDASDSD